MKTVVIESIRMPEYAICYIEYGDKSSVNLEEEDFVIIDKWLDNLKKQYPDSYFNFSYGETGHFTHSPAFGLPCTCVDCTITVMTK